MKKQKKVLSLVLAAIMVAAAVTGCGKVPKGSDTTTPDKETTSPSSQLSTVDNDLKVEVEGEVDTSKTLTTLIDCDASPAFNGNPFDDVAGANWSIQPFLYDYLAFFSPFPEREFRASLLDSYTYENKVLTLKLQDGLKWSDGSVLNADDLMTNFYCQVGRSAMWQYIDKLEKKDDLTVVLTFVQDSPLILNLVFAIPVMTPNEVYDEWATQYKEIAETQREIDAATGAYKYKDGTQDKLTPINEALLAYKPKPEEIIGSGPYVIDKHNTSEILFIPSTNYRKAPLISAVRGLRPGDAQAFSTAILAGEYTIENGGLSIDMSKQIDERYKDTMRKFYVPELSSIGYSMNVNVYPLDIPEVRKAISMLVDKESLVKIAEPGSFTGDKTNSGLLPSLHSVYTTESFTNTLTDYSYNPDEAAKLLESVGWKKEGGKWLDDKGNHVPISIATINSWPSFMLTAEAMSAMLTEQGINIEFKPMEFGVWNDWTKNDSEKMIACTFIASSPNYAHPWESFNEYMQTNLRAGFGKLDAGKERIFKLPSTGEEVNVTALINKLYLAQDTAEITKLTEELMKIGNDMCGYVSVIEKTAPYRVYDPKLNLGGDCKVNEVQSSYYYYGNINNVLAKLISEDLIYFTK